MRSSRRSYVQRHRRRGVCRGMRLAIGALTLGAGLSGCTGEEPAQPDRGATSSPTDGAGTPTAQPVVTESSIDRVDGDFDASRRAVLRSRVSKALDTWIDGAYGGAYPRDDFSEAFDSFTTGAARRAKQDAGLLSNAAVGLEVDDVRAIRRRVHLDILGVAGRAAAVTARVDLVFDLTGEITRRDTISGRLYLTFDTSSGGPRAAPGWRVFGYDLRRKGA